MSNKKSKRQVSAIVPKGESKTVASPKVVDATLTALPKLPKLPSNSTRKARAPKPLVPCACGGCGAQTRGTWAPGHDAYVKGWAIRIEREVCKMSDVPEQVRPGVKRVLKERAEAGTKGELKVVKGGKAESADTPETGAA